MRVAALLGVLCACRNRDAASRANGLEKPLQVASVISGCKALAECERQCDELNANACVAAGHDSEFGRGAPLDPVLAFQLYERACGLDYGSGCYNAAVLLETGKGVAKDLARARGLFTKVCEMGSKTACGRATMLTRAAADH